MNSARLLALCCLAGLLAVPAAAQVPDDLASKKDYKAFKAATADPTGRNADARSIEPGATLTLADVKGSGRITHIWFTIAAQSPDHLRELVLRMTWDDASKPAVECPVGDFFAQGHGKSDMSSLPALRSPSVRAWPSTVTGPCPSSDMR
jgi:hypothetical protein